MWRVGKHGEVWKMWGRCVWGVGKCVWVWGEMWDMCWGRGNVKEVRVQGNEGRRVGNCVRELGGGVLGCRKVGGRGKMWGEVKKKFGGSEKMWERCEKVCWGVEEWVRSLLGSGEMTWEK